MVGNLLRVIFLLAAAVTLVRCDLPIDCRYSDALGTWLYTETERIGDPSLNCDELGETVYDKEFTLEYPNVVSDELGNQGTWTLIYNQGFEVNINGRSYWAPFYYDDALRSYSCDRLYNGWSRDKTVRNWSCFTGVKAGVTKATMRKFVAPRLAKPNEKYTNDQNLIDRINSAQSSWTAKAYPQHEQYTRQEMLLRAGGQHHTPPPTRPATVAEKARASLLPKNFDWSDVEGISYLSPVRDQANCGSCYTFSSTGLIEAKLRIQTQGERQDVFSNQDIISCTKLAEGCMGGFSYLIAGRYAMDQGFVDESCNPYLAIDEVCDTDLSCPRTFVSDYEYLGGYYGASNEEIMMEALVTRGPLGVDFEVTSDFYAYSGGIYSHTGLKQEFDPFVLVNHAVLLVGYGEDETTGEKYWKVKNSWGADWGEDGFFRIRRGTNEVGIESAAFDAVVIP